MKDDTMRSDPPGPQEQRKLLPWWVAVRLEMADGKYDERVYCRDCGRNVGTISDWYMLRDEIWAATGMAPAGGVLCLIDVERRLGRDLQEEDFAVADESDCGGGFFWPGHRMLPKSWNAHVFERTKSTRGTPAAFNR